MKYILLFLLFIVLCFNGFLVVECLKLRAAAPRSSSSKGTTPSGARSLSPGIGISNPSGGVSKSPTKSDSTLKSGSGSKPMGLAAGGRKNMISKFVAAKQTSILQIHAFCLLQEEWLTDKSRGSHSQIRCERLYQNGEVVVNDSKDGDGKNFPWQLNVRGAHSALAFSILTVKEESPVKVFINCNVLPKNQVVIVTTTGKKISNKIFDCSGGEKVSPGDYPILSKIDSFVNNRPDTLHNELLRIFNLAKITYTYVGYGKVKKLIKFHPQPYLLFDARGFSMHRDVLFIERLNAIPYAKVVETMKHPKLLESLLKDQTLEAMKILLAKWYRRLLRAIWLPVYSEALFMLQRIYKLHCDFHTGNIMITLPENFDIKLGANVVLNMMRFVDPSHIRIIDVGNTQSFTTKETQELNDPCRALEHRPYEDIGMIDVRILIPLTKPAAIPSFITEPHGGEKYVDGLPTSAFGLLTYYNEKLNSLRETLHSFMNWKSCRVQKNDKQKYVRVYADAKANPCTFLDQRIAILFACALIKKYTSQEKMGLPSCTFENPRDTPKRWDEKGVLVK